MKSVNVHTYSLSTFQVAQISRDTGIQYGSGTAFLCKHRDSLFVVTNYHIASGYRPGTDNLASTTGATPGRLDADIAISKSLGNGKHKDEFRATCIDLIDGDNKPKWLVHPDFGTSCDVVAIPLVGITLKEGYNFVPIDLQKAIDHEINLGVMDELFIIGFPLDREKALSKLPIYKAGFVASEPEDTHNGAQFYADAKTKPGMSGSPVVQRERAKVSSGQKGNFTFTEGKINFIGVYSGRAEERTKEYEAELGIIWPFHDFLIPTLDKYCDQVQ